MSKIDNLKIRIYELKNSVSDLREVNKLFKPKEISRNFKKADSLELKIDKIEKSLKRLNDRSQKYMQKAESFLNRSYAKNNYEKIVLNNFEIRDDFDFNQFGIDRKETNRLPEIDGSGIEINSDSIDIK